VPNPPGDGAPPLEALVDRYQKRIYAVIYRMTGHHGIRMISARSVSQIFRSLPGFKPGSNLDSWFTGSR